MKKNLIATSLAILIGVSFASISSLGQNTAIIKKSAQTAASGISVSTSKGKTIIVYKGKEVWTGKTTGKVSGKTKVVNGKEYVAAFDGDKVIWENVTGAGAKVK